MVRFMNVGKKRLGAKSGQGKAFVFVTTLIKNNIII